MMKATSVKSSEADYRSGNLDKYRSKNPLKRILTERLERRIEQCSAPYSRILDAGAGEGFIAARLARGEDRQVTLVDLSEEALRYAAALCPENCIFVRSDVTHLPFADESFELVVCSEVLEHLPDPAAGLRELLRVSSGAVLLTVPWEPWFRLGNVLSLKNLSRLGDPPDHCNHWTRSGFCRWIAENARGWSAESGVSFPWSMVFLRKDPRP